MGITRLGQLAAADVSRKELQKQSKQQAASSTDQQSLLEQLLWESRQTNKMLWAALSEEQRAAVKSMQ